VAKTFQPYVGPRIIPGHVDCIVQGSCFGNLVENVYGFKYTGTRPTGAELAQLGTEFLPALYNVQKTNTVTNMSFISAQMVDIGIAGGNTATFVFNPNTNGTNTGSDLPLNVAASVELKTGKRGRRFKGAKRWSALPENEVDHNSFSSNLMGWLAQLGLLLVRTYVSGKFAPAVGSLPHMPPLGQVGPPSPAESNVIASVSTVDNNTDSQKTRLNRRGR
jgi:hypothetical protein